MFIIRRVFKKGMHKTIDMFLKNMRVSCFLWFFSPYVLCAYLIHNGKYLYIAEYNNEKALILHRKREKDIRFLFFVPSKEMYEYVFKYFKPTYVAYNEIIQSEIIDDSFTCEQEHFANIESIVNLKDEDIRHEYRKSLKRHPNISIHRYETKNKRESSFFLKLWAKSRKDEQNKITDIKNDINFINLYGENPTIVGFCFTDKRKIKGLSFFVINKSEKSCTWIIGKSLKEYSNLGRVVLIESFMELQKLGCVTVNIGVADNLFMKKLTPYSEAVNFYSKKIFCSDELSENYLLNYYDMY